MVGLLRVSRRIVGMTVNEILTQLKPPGDDARRAHNTKAGAPDNQFGVKLGDIRAMAKKIKTDHELALNLWDTGNVEAQLLATLIIKPKSLSADELDKLTRSTLPGADPTVVSPAAIWRRRPKLERDRVAS